MSFLFKTLGKEVTNKMKIPLEEAKLLFQAKEKILKIFISRNQQEEQSFTIKIIIYLL